MKVLLVSAADAGGGAFIAARRLHLALLKHGVDSHILLAKSTKGLPNSTGPDSNTSHTRADLRNYSSLPLYWLDRADVGELRSFNIFPSGLHRKINEFNADIVNLHWVNREMLSIAEIGRIKAPIVWTLHDMWPLLGSEHYQSLEASEKKPGPLDIDSWMYWRKKRRWSERSISFVGPSQWMTKQAAQSKNFSHLPGYTIPNPIDLDLYKPLSSEFAKEALGLDANKRYLLYGSMSGTSDRRKGFGHLRDALAQFDSSAIEDIKLLTFGSSAHPQDLPKIWRDKVSTLGFLADDFSLALAYSAADIFIVPSELDNLPNTIAESLACGTPVVTFAGTGGCSEMLEHKRSGYIAAKFNSDDIATGINWLLNHKDHRALRINARNQAKELFAEPNVVKSYCRVFQSIIDQQSSFTKS